MNAEAPFAQRLESPPWFEAGSPLGPEAAQHALRGFSAEALRSRQPYCIYVHVPFCASICSFCALHTRAVPASSGALFDRFVDRLIGSAHDHPRAGSAQPPTTVHFGGGTPLHLGLDRLDRVVHALRAAFGDAPGCEWAIETTTSSLDEACLERLAALRIERVHLGIQTLDDALRRRLGRRESGAAAIGRLQRLQQLGFRASVDLILGLPDADAGVLADDLQRLFDAGVRMFSICELRPRSPRDAGPARSCDRARRHRALWGAVWAFMAGRGLAPIHLGQFARTQADNLYYTHPARGEDCVALGPYAHGSMGRLAYANRVDPGWTDAAAAGGSTLAHGVLQWPAFDAALALERSLLAHRVPQARLRAALQACPQLADPVERWRHRGLLLATDADDMLALSESGSWYVGNLIDELRTAAMAAVGRRAHSRACADSAA